MDELIGVIRGMVFMTFFAIALDKWGMKDGKILFHVLMTTETELPSPYRKKKLVGCRVRRVAGNAFPSSGRSMHVYLLELLCSLFVAVITEPW